MTMHAIDAIPIFLSLDVTADLVRRGIRAPWKQGATMGDAPTYTLDVLGASNTTPIVLTVADGSLGVLPPRAPDAAHGWSGRVYHVVVAGVGGNTAANKLDDKPQRNEAWIAVATSPTTLELYDLDTSTGDLVPSVGNGVYTGGGTISKAFSDGVIRVSQDFVSENTAPTQVVFIPSTEDDLASLTTSSFNALALASGEVDRMRISPSFRAQRIWYEVHVWAPSPNVMGAPQFGPAQLIKEAILRAAQSRASACWAVKTTDWRSQHPEMYQRNRVGQWLVFTLGLDVPIPRDAVMFAPDPTVADLGLFLSLNGTAEEA